MVILTSHRAENHKFKACLGNLVRPCQSQNKNLASMREVLGSILILSKHFQESKHCMGQEELEFEVSLGCLLRPCLNNTQLKLFWLKCINTGRNCKKALRFLFCKCCQGTEFLKTVEI